jgi:hypothetical protein
MDLHKPKPWHGAREFLKEYLIIVIGVLTALGGEQVVEWLHGLHQAHAGEAVLRVAYVREADNAALRQALDGCVTQRLAELSSILRQAEETGRLPPVAAVRHPPTKPWTIGAWNVLVADQTVSRLPRQKAIDYTSIFQQTAFLSALADREEDEWTVLDSMAGPGRRLSDVEAEQLRTALATAARSNARMTFSSGRLREAVRATGLLAASDFTDAIRRAQDGAANADICRPIEASPGPVGRS